MPRLQYMPINDFDRGLVEKFETQDFEYNPANWDRLTKKLPASQRSRTVRRYIWLPLSGIAAAIALLLAVPAIRNNNGNTAGDIAAVKTAAAANTPTPDTKNVTPVTDPAPIANTKVNNTQSSVGIAGNKQTIRLTQPASMIIPDVVKANPAPVQTPVQKVPDPEQPQAPQNIQPVANSVTPSMPPVAHQTPEKPAPEVIVPETPAIRSNPEQPVATNLQEPVKMTNANDQKLLVDPHFGKTIDPDDVGLRNNDRKAASLSVAGGYNRGNTDIGYMIGFNTRKPLGSKLYLEGDIAFAANRNSQKTVSMGSDWYETRTPAEKQALLNELKAAGDEYDYVQNLYYLQVTPVLGYQAMKNLSFGAGADVQRLFGSADKTNVVAGDAEIKSVPSFDYGLVGKTEYRLFKNLKAGVQYRYGLTDALAPEKNYINRSYLQVQLKLGILGNNNR